MNLPRRSIADIAGGRPFFATIAETHSHPGNIERVARGEIDATCVDCVTYAFFCRHRPAIGELTRVLAVTYPSPSIPFVTSVSAPDELKQRLRNALFRVARADEWSHVREGLMLRDIVPVDDETSYAALSHTRRRRANSAIPSCAECPSPRSSPGLRLGDQRPGRYEFKELDATGLLTFRGRPACCVDRAVRDRTTNWEEDETLLPSRRSNRPARRGDRPVDAGEGLETLDRARVGPE